MKSDDHTDKIEAFVNHQMSDTEKVAFKTALKSDPELEKAVKLRILEKEMTWLFAEKELRNNLQEWKKGINLGEETNLEQPKVNKSTGRVRTLRGSLSIAASILFIVTASLFFWANTQFSNTSMIAQQYIGADLPGDKSGSEASLDTQYEAGLTAFAKQDYSTTIQELTTIPSADSNYIAAQYFIGHSQYLAKKYQAAITPFKTVLAQSALPSFINKDKLQWNLLLAYVGNEQLDQDFQTLLADVITNGKPPYQQKAKELKENLDSVWRGLVF